MGCQSRCVGISAPDTAGLGPLWTDGFVWKAVHLFGVTNAPDPPATDH